MGALAMLGRIRMLSQGAALKENIPVGPLSFDTFA